MDSRAAGSAETWTAETWSAESRAALEAVAASVAALAAFTGTGTARPDPSGTDRWRDADPLGRLADDYLDGLAAVARLEARTAALKVRLAADYMRAAGALAPPAASPQEHTAHPVS